jgi:hypothetical protein
MFKRFPAIECSLIKTVAELFSLPFQGDKGLAGEFSPKVLKSRGMFLSLPDLLRR